ncbi:MAG: sigma-70 family RNA polymerase sigma factor [Acidobacteria bacterium]|nr:sigma-70 family RNA polymerase sigma factor [Acidobacteriota bacterium]
MVFERLCRPVFSFILGFVGEAGLAEDLTQETFVRAYRGLKSLRREARLSTWVFGIARNVAREAMRAKHSGRAPVEIDESEWHEIRDDRAMPDRGVINSELQNRLQQAVAGLPERQRAVFLLRAVNHMRYEEIAAIIGGSVTGLKTDMHRARKAMRVRLAPYLERQASVLRGES